MEPAIRLKFMDENNGWLNLMLRPFRELRFNLFRRCLEYFPQPKLAPADLLIPLSRGANEIVAIINFLAEIVRLLPVESLLHVLRPILGFAAFPQIDSAIVSFVSEWCKTNWAPSEKLHEVLSQAAAKLITADRRGNADIIFCLRHLASRQDFPDKIDGESILHYAITRQGTFAIPELLEYVATSLSCHEMLDLTRIIGLVLPVSKSSAPRLMPTATLRGSIWRN